MATPTTPSTPPAEPQTLAAKFEVSLELKDGVDIFAAMEAINKIVRDARKVANVTGYIQVGRVKYPLGETPPSEGTEA